MTTPRGGLESFADADLLREVLVEQLGPRVQRFLDDIVAGCPPVGSDREDWRAAVDVCQQRLTDFAKASMADTTVLLAAAVQSVSRVVNLTKEIACESSVDPNMAEFIGDIPKGI